jgi:putative membrane protein
MEARNATESKADLRDYLAAERTLLAWIRTGLALMGFGFVVARFALFLKELLVAEASRNFPVPSYGLSLWFGIALIAAGVIVNTSAALHYRRLVDALARGERERPHLPRQAIVIALFLAFVGLAMAIYLISIRSSIS